MLLRLFALLYFTFAQSISEIFNSFSAIDWPHPRMSNKVIPGVHTLLAIYLFVLVLFSFFLSFFFFGGGDGGGGSIYCRCPTYMYSRLIEIKLLDGVRKLRH